MSMQISKMIETLLFDIYHCRPRCRYRYDQLACISSQHGFIHGGVVGAIADNAAGYAAYSLIDSYDSVLTVEYKLNLLTPAKGERVEARAEVMRPGRTLTIVRSDVSAYDDGMETLCATAVVTLIRMAGWSDQRGG